MIADALDLHRFQFAFTITYHYLFPQLTMGLALLVLVFKTLGLRGDRIADETARFWGKLLGINFAFGVITGIPMEFQFGTNWARFSEAAGGVIGQTLAMEGIFAFFLESSFLGLFLYGEKRLGPRGHWGVALAVCLGAWISAYFITATNAWMQHPVGYQIVDGRIELTSLLALFTNPWHFWQYAHTMAGTVATASFVVSGIGAYYLLAGRYHDHARMCLRVGVPAALVASLILPMPTGDMQAKMLYQHQGPTFAAMEGLFTSEEGAPIVLIGQPDVEKGRIDNPIPVPRLLSFLTHGRWMAEVRGLDAFPRETWPTNIPLLYYAYHVMAGLGTIFIGVSMLAAVWLWRDRLHSARPLLWALFLVTPFPYVANTAGWMTAELGRQPWLIYGVMKTADGTSAQVSSGNVLFTLIGFMGMYAMLSILWLFLMQREVAAGPERPAP